MKKIIIFLFVNFAIVAQERKDFFLSEFLFEEKLLKVNIKGDFQNFDLSNIIMNYSESGYGYFGKEKIRADMILLSVIKNPIKDNYLIYGKTFINNLISEFQGTILIKNVQYLSNYLNRYLITGEFQFFENNERMKTILEGDCFFKVIDEKGELKQDMSDFLSNKHYYNNAYLGKRYKVGSEYSECKTMFNWGSLTPPLAGDLNIGKHHFRPNPKYLDSGWESLIEAYNRGGGIIVDEVYNQWWK